MTRPCFSPPQQAAGWIGKVLLLLILIGGAAAAVAWHDYRQFAQSPLPNTGHVPLEVKPGDSLRSIVARLAALGLTDDWRRPWWQAIAWQADNIHRLQAGEYSIEPGLTPQTLLAKLASGRVVQYSFTIVEGWNFTQLRQALAAVQHIEHTLADQSDAMIMTTLGADGQHPEGWFLPETYAYTRGASDLDLLKRAHDAMKTELDRVWASRKPATAVGNDYHALILASIIEKETGVPAERRRIAGVFSRRLGIGMRLQTDPTVIYGVGTAYDGNLRRRDLDTDTPYNTYTRVGLPPTPIAMPGRAALEAAVDPDDGKALYFVSRGDGSHYFSTTYNEHLNAVRRYQLGQRRRATEPADAVDDTAASDSDSDSGS